MTPSQGLLKKMSIRKKLLSAFISLILIVVLTGGCGFIFIKLIRENVELLTDVASPLSTMSNEIYNDMLEFNILSFNLQNAETVEEVDLYASEFKQLEAQFKQKVLNLEQFIQDKNTELNLKKLKENQSLFFEQIHLAETVQSEKLSRIKSIKNNLAIFNEKRSQLDESLDDYIKSSRTTIGQAEEKGMMIAMDSSATVQDATDLISNMFAKTLPVLYKGEELRTFLTSLQDLTKTFLLETETESLDSIQESFVELSKKIQSRMKRLKRKLETDEIKEIYDRITLQFDELFTIVLNDQGLFAGRRNLIEQQEASKQLQVNLTKMTQAFRKEILAVLTKSSDISSQVQETTKKRVGAAQLYIGIIVFAGFILGISAAVLIIGSITQPLVRLRQMVLEVEKTSDFSLRSDLANQDEVGQTSQAFNSHMKRIQTALSDVNAVMKSISQGDFSTSLESRQEGDLLQLKQSINDSIKLLSQTIEGVITISSHVDNQADALADSAMTFKKSAGNQAESLKTISIDMDEIESMARTNEKNAIQVLEYSDKAINEVNNGNTQMNQMLLSMKKIEETGTDVGNAIKVINDIASQTHLLALNAAIEAVRVGEIGKGFGVVAQEVRDLAGRSAKAAKETGELIRKSNEEVKRGLENADQTAAAFNEINRTVEEVNSLVSSISSASSEQSSRIKNTNTNITGMNKTIVRDSVIVEETVSAVHELKSRSKELQQVLARFVLKK